MQGFETEVNYIYEYFFCDINNNRGKVESINNEIWIDVGNLIDVGTFDHRGQINKDNSYEVEKRNYGSTVELLLKELHLLRETKKKIIEGKTETKIKIRICTHNEPNMNAIVAIYLFKEYIEKGEDVYKCTYCDTKLGDKIIEYINNIGSGKGKILSKQTFYALFSVLDSEEMCKFQKISTDNEKYLKKLEIGLKWVGYLIDKIKGDYQYDLLNDKFELEESKEEYEKYRKACDIVERFEELYDLHKIEKKVVIKNIKIWDDEGNIQEVEAAIWLEECEEAELLYGIAREKGVALTFVPSTKNGKTSVIVSINPSDENNQKYSLMELAKIYEQLEQVYEYNSTVKRDYSKPRGEKSIFLSEPFMCTSDPWYINEKNNLVASPSCGTKIPLNILIDVLENVTHIVNRTFFLNIASDNKDNGLEVFVNEDIFKKSMSKCIEKAKEFLKKKSASENYKVLILDIDSSLITHNYEILDLYYKNITGVTQVENDIYDKMHIDYRTHIYATQSNAVIFLATNEYEKNDEFMNGMLNLSAKEAICESKLIEIFKKLFKHKVKLNECGKFIGEFLEKRKEVKRKNEELIKLLAEVQKDDCIDDQFEYEVYSYVKRNLGINEMMSSVNNSMQLIVEYTKEKTYERLNVLSLITIPFLIITALFEMGMVEISPIIKFEKYIGCQWFAVFGIVVFVTAICFYKNK